MADEKDTQGIEVTPEMIEAGMEAYMAHHPDTVFGFDFERRVVSEIFSAMYRARSSPARTSPDPGYDDERHRRDR